MRIPSRSESWRLRFGGAAFAAFLALPLPVCARIADAARPPGAPPAAAPVTPEAARASLASLPLAFEANRGQADSRMRFLARAGGASVSVSPDAIRLVLRGAGRRGAALAVRFAGASASPAVEGVGLQPGKVNYLLGDDPRRWRTDIPTYRAVRSRGVYPGVDLVCYGNGGDVEYDFVVAPGADPEAIRLEVEGASSTRLDRRTGDLVVRTAVGEVHQRAPALYQETPAGRRSVAGRYVARGAGFGVEAGAYDRALPLVVDPVLRYSTYIGGGAAEALNGVAVDAAGSAYVTGNTPSTNYPTTPGAFQTDQPSDDVVVTKLSPAGNTLVYSTYLGGDAGDFGDGIAIDTAGTAFVAGVTFSTNFPTVNQFQTNQPLGDAFVTRLNAAGNGLLYSTYLGGAGDDIAIGVAVEATGAVYVTGGADSNDYPTTLGAFQTARTAAALTTFLSRINPGAAGASSLVYSTFIGDAGEGFGITTDGAGRAIVVGRADGAGFPTTAGAVQTDQPGADGYATKIDTALSGPSGLVFSTYLGGDLSDTARGVAIDAAGNAHVVGVTASSNFPTTAGGFQPAPPNPATSDTDAFFVKLNAGATALLYGTYLGGTADEEALSVSLSSSGSVYVAGDTFSTNFPTTPGAIVGDQPDQDGFATRFDPTRSGAASLVSSTYLGGDGFDIASAIAATALGEAYVAGYTQSTNFPTVNPFQTDQGGIDAFALKISLDSGAGGSDTIGIYTPANGAFFLRNSNTSGVADIVFTYGAGGSVVPVMGDFDGDGDDTAGLYDPATGAFFLRNSNSPGAADVVFTFGPGGAGFVPLSGDWDGDGDDTVGLYAPSTGTFFLRNTNAPGAADIAFAFGPGGAGIVPITGDWDGDGVDTVGIYVTASGVFFLRNANAPGAADIVFTFGAGGAVPVTGDFDNDGVETVGIYVPGSGTWFLKNSNAPGAADAAFGYGPPNATPLVGDWDGL